MTDENPDICRKCGSSQTQVEPTMSNGIKCYTCGHIWWEESK